MTTNTDPLNNAAEALAILAAQVRGELTTPAP